MCILACGVYGGTSKDQESRAGCFQEDLTADWLRLPCLGQSLAPIQAELGKSPSLCFPVDVYYE